MTNHGQRTPARLTFRRLAFYVGILCFLAAGVFVVFQPGGKSNWVGVVSGLLVGFVMLTIGKTGHWPAPKRRH